MHEHRRSRRPSPAMVVSLIALFVSLSGVSYAAVTIGSAQIRDGSITGRDIKNRAIGLRDLSSGARNGLDGPRGPIGPTGAIGPAGPQGPAGPAGPTGAGALQPLRSGERIYGTFAFQGNSQNQWQGVSFPIPAPQPVDSYHVVIAGNDTVGGEGCTGTARDPVSAPGFVCIYPTQAVNTETGYGWGTHCSCTNPQDRGDGSRFGFSVQTNRDASPGTFMSAAGSWVYTAP